MNTETNPFEVAIFLVPGYSQLSLATLIEPFRLANTVAGKKLYTWSLYSEDASPVASSSGFNTSVDCKFSAVEKCDALFVVASYGALSHVSGSSLCAIRRIARTGAHIGAIDAGGFFLAEAGLLDGRRATTHWDDLEAFQHRYPRIEVVSDRYVNEERRSTTSGSLPSFDFTLDFIKRRDGLALASRVSGNFIYDNQQPGSQPQSMISLAHLQIRKPKIARVVKLMEENLQSPLGLEDLASRVGYSGRTLHRRFQEALGKSPQAYYRMLRLEVAKRMIEASNCSVSDAAAASGYKTRGALTRAFRETFGQPPAAFK